MIYPQIMMSQWMKWGIQFSVSPAGGEPSLGTLLCCLGQWPLWVRQRHHRNSGQGFTWNSKALVTE